VDDSSPDGDVSRTVRDSIQKRVESVRKNVNTPGRQDSGPGSTSGQFFDHRGEWGGSDQTDHLERVRARTVSDTARRSRATTPSAKSYQASSLDDYNESGPSSAPGERGGERNGGGSSGSGGVSAPARQPSIFARSVVNDLGVEDGEAPAAMSVIDRVSSMTPEQLSRLDPATRNQVMQIRSQLGLGSVSGVEQEKAAPPVQVPTQAYTTPAPQGRTVRPSTRDENFSQLDFI